MFYQNEGQSGWIRACIDYPKHYLITVYRSGEKQPATDLLWNLFIHGELSSSPCLRVDFGKFIVPELVLERVKTELDANGIKYLDPVAQFAHVVEET